MASALRSFDPDPHFDRGATRAPLGTLPHRRHSDRAGRRFDRQAEHQADRQADRQADVTVIVRPDRERGHQLDRLKNISSAICGVLVLAASAAYGERVYVDMRTDTARERLATLQHNQHQLSVSIEALKYQAAQLAEASDTGLIPQTPDRFLFVEPALSRPDRQQPAAPASTPPQFPIGY